MSLRTSSSSSLGPFDRHRSSSLMGAYLSWSWSHHPLTSSSSLGPLGHRWHHRSSSLMGAYLSCHRHLSSSSSSLGRFYRLASSLMGAYLSWSWSHHPLRSSSSLGPLGHRWHHLASSL